MECLIPYRSEFFLLFEMHGLTVVEGGIEISSILYSEREVVLIE